MHHAEDGAGSPLRALAAAAGILPAYVDMGGTTRETSHDTTVRLLAAMGVDAADDTAARRALDELREREAASPLEPARVIARPRGGGVECAPLVARVAAPEGSVVRYDLEVHEEGGTHHRAEGEARVAADGVLRLATPQAPELGYHRVRLAVRGDGGERAGEQTLIVVPASCPSPAAVLRGQRVFGLTANLYTVRSGRNWGVGDLGDLSELLAYARGVGAAFVGVSPLHALRNAGSDVSPYSPVSRLFRNPLYVDVTAVPELADAPEASALLDSPEARAEIARLRATSRVDYDGVMRLKRDVLALLHDAFRRAPTPGRQAAYATFRAEQGEALDDFATFAALDEHFRARGAGWWREWPEPYRDRRSAAVAEFRAAHETAVDFHRWLQFETDRQLGEAARRGRALGLPVGLYEDLAIGTSPAGSDPWAEPELFARGVSIGAPPDPLGPEGQNWGLPPIDPRRLAATGYAYWARLLRSAMRHAGALRLDHVLGLFRQFWIPEGMTGREGAYVRFPSEELLGILALEATRANALVVGEDLGTVPPEVGPTLARWGVLSSKVLYFEREWEQGGRFKPPRAYPAMALATANTHDLAPLAGFWAGRDIAVRRDVGQIADDAEEARARDERARDREALLALLADEGVLDRALVARGADAVDDATLRAAVHALLRRTPSWLVGLSLDDLVGETEMVNVPGVGSDRYPTWTRRLSVPIEALAGDPAVRRALGAEREWIDRG
jgi:4-alpha-glucanotransferase